MDFLNPVFWALANLDNWLLGIEDVRNIGEGYAVLLTGILVVAGWVISDRTATRQHRRSTAHQYLIEKNAVLSANVLKLKKILKERAPISAVIGESLDQSQKDALVVLSDMEMMANDIRFGLADERYVANAQHARMINIFELSKGFVGEFRRTRGTPTTFEDFEVFYIRMRYKSGLGITRVVEAFLNRPAFPITRRIFAMKYDLCRFLYGLPPSHLDAQYEQVRQAFWKLDWLLRPAVAIAALWLAHQALLRLSS